MYPKLTSKVPATTIAATLIAGPVADILIGQGFTNANAYRGSFIAAIVLVVIGVVALLVAFRYVRKIEITEDVLENIELEDDGLTLE